MKSSYLLALLFGSATCLAQPKTYDSGKASNSQPDTIMFRKGSATLQKEDSIRLIALCSKWKEQSRYYISVVGYGSHKGDISYRQSDEVERLLVANCGIDRYAIRSLSGMKGGRDMVVIRLSTTEENKSTNCKRPPLPKLRK